MSYNSQLPKLFFQDLKKYNKTNFKTIERADLSKEDAVVHKSCSSVVTRFFLFMERHPEVPEPDMRILYFQLKIDMIAKYFSEYPMSSFKDLEPFQAELRKYARSVKGEEDYE